MAVAAAYTLEADAGGGVYRYGFRLGAYDRRRPLVLDPAVLVYAGYIGGVQDEFGFAIAVDSAGNAYVAGRTESTDTAVPASAAFPVTVGPDVTYNAGEDAFIAKVNAAGTGLVYAGYIVSPAPRAPRRARGRPDGPDWRQPAQAGSGPATEMSRRSVFTWTRAGPGCASAAWKASANSAVRSTVKAATP